jgi:hypothetical protein
MLTADNWRMIASRSVSPIDVIGGHPLLKSMLPNIEVVASLDPVTLATTGRCPALRRARTISANIGKYRWLFR